MVSGSRLPFFIVLTVVLVYVFSKVALYLTDKRSSITKQNVKYLLYNRNSHKTNKRLYSTWSRPSYYIKDIYEKDNGQNTTNPHLLAMRNIITGKATIARIINLVQPTISINEQMLLKLSSISGVKLPNRLRDIRVTFQ